MDYHFGHLDVRLRKFQEQVDGVALHFLGGVTELVDNDVKYDILHLWLLLEAALERV
jgi:hypothetical protein